MSYEAIVCRITTRPHPNADRLQLANAAGYSCVIGLDHKDGDLGVVFPEGGQLSREFCLANKLYRKHPDTGVAMGGYLDHNRRVKAMKLRGVESDGLWLPAAAVVAWLSAVGGNHVFEAKEGAHLTEVSGLTLCGKYYTPATLRAMRSKSPTTKLSNKAAALERHYDTPQLRSSALPPGNVWITEKVHGTSGRTGHVRVDQPLAWWATLLNRLPLVNIKPRGTWEYVSGTRNCILADTAGGEKGKGYRLMAHDLIAPRLHRGEIWYYEISGFEDTGVPIMAPHRIGSIGDPRLERWLPELVGGDHVVYHYGCKSNGRLPVGAEARQTGPVRFKIHVYRITQDGEDLLMADVIERVSEVLAGMSPGLHEFLSTVPVLAYHREGSWVEGQLRAECDERSRQHSALDMPFREGVCVRIESPVGDKVIVHKALKHKGFVFCALEGIKKNDPDYLDVEEIA